MTNHLHVINVHQAKTHLSRLLDRARDGEEIILGKGGKPYAKLVPLDAGEARTPGQLQGLTLSSKFFDPLPDDELGAWDGGSDGEER